MPGSLTTRVSTFFLGVLACVLIGFATTFYLLARTYLYGQIDDRLEAGLNTLVAAAETTDRGLEWEPTEHSISLGTPGGGEQLVWLVQAEEGRVLEQSHGLSPEQQAVIPLLVASQSREDRILDQNRRPWRVRQRHLSGSESAIEQQKNSDLATSERAAHHVAFVMSIGASLVTVEATLRNLLLVLIGLSVGLWIVAVLIGSWLCRRALVPVTRMAATARSLRPDALDQRLPSPETRDELEDLCRAFNDLLARLHESFERQARFTGDASHQLRSPLTVMLGQIDVALLRPRSPDEYRQALVQTRAQAGRLTDIVETLLFLSRADSESQLSNLEPIELDSWLTKHLQTWSGHGRAKDIRKDFRAGESVWISAQSSLLAQLVDNLLDNAAKYSPPATPITVGLSVDDHSAMITVEDVGYGIAAADLPHIFEPFFRSDEARQLGKSGVGLGLAVAQRIARVFGGQIQAASPPGRLGSRFCLRLPRLLDVAEERSSVEPATEGAEKLSVPTSSL